MSSCLRLSKCLVDFYIHTYDFARVFFLWVYRFDCMIHRDIRLVCQFLACPVMAVVSISRGIHIPFACKKCLILFCIFYLLLSI